MCVLGGGGGGCVSHSSSPLSSPRRSSFLKLTRPKRCLPRNVIKTNRKDANEVNVNSPHSVANNCRNERGIRQEMGQESRPDYTG